MEQKTFDREAMRITVDYNNMMQETLGARGLTTFRQPWIQKKSPYLRTLSMMRITDFSEARLPQ